jgi:NAD(P) transhydrogenase subunit beta
VNLNIVINLLYIVSAVFFILGLKMLSSPASARKGNLISAAGMLLAVAATLLTKGMSFQWIILGSIIGTILGIISAHMVAMTAMPEMVALLNGSGGLSSLLVGWAVYHFNPQTDVFTALTIFLSVLIGGVTFTGSVVAWAKLSEKLPGKPILYRGQQIVNLLLLLVVLVGGAVFTVNPGNYPLFIITIIVSLILGVLAVIPIGGADMPVVISLLNSYSGIAACTTGFVIQNNILIVAGTLVGASGLILTQIMCKAMNRSLANVLFSGFGAVVQKQGGDSIQHGEVKPIKTKDAYYILEAARSVVFVPGYGLAVAQAQHVARELGELLEANGAEVRYAIHPVAGRMPGHMNVLLAEANVPYDQLFEMDSINPLMETVDVCIVIGANDVVNPAARHDKSSPIYGMPIINVDKAKTVIVLKRSMAAGFAGVQNELFFYENTRMLFGDAKASIQGLVAEFKGS